jgi:hypothetical protein
MLHGRIGIVGLTLVLCATSVATPAQDEPPEASPPANEAFPGMTEEGNWHGTWTYLNRNEQVMLWIDTHGEKPRVKLQYFSLVTPESFQTDWDGMATYELAGEPATFHMEITNGDANRLEGTWLWDVQFSGAGRSERGVFTLYRVGDGRQATIRFSDYEKVLRKGEKVSRYSGAASWNFKQVSKRHAPWQEVF